MSKSADAFSRQPDCWTLPAHVCWYPLLPVAIGASPAIEAVDEEDSSTIDAGTKDSVLVGRVKRDDAVPNGIWIWAVCDNLRRGSSLNAVLVAEAMFNDFAWAN